MENTDHKLKLNVIKELIRIRCSPHKKNSQNKLAIDNLIKDKDTKSKKCLQKYMDETEGMFYVVFISNRLYLFNINIRYMKRCNNQNKKGTDKLQNIYYM